MTIPAGSRDRLVDYLEQLAVRQDRATLARLRAGLRTDRRLEGLSAVLPFVVSGKVPQEVAEDTALLIGGLFALHPESGGVPLPRALRTFAGMDDRAPIERRGSVEQRFRALLAADRRDLAPHLRYAVSLAASSGLGLDWRDLHRAIRFWDHPAGRSRRHWARLFWAPEGPESVNANPSDER